MRDSADTVADELAAIRDELLRRHSFVVSSHARPDGDSIGSQLALAYALRALGKQVHVVNRDPAPEPFRGLPGVGDIEIASEVKGPYDAALVMECSDLARTGVAGLDRYFVVNVDHHPGNARYGALNWFDPTAAACGEMVYDLVRQLGVPLSLEIATHLYLAILTDTGSFHYSNITARTFEICRALVNAGVNPAGMARLVYDSSHVGRLKLLGVLLNTMQLDASGRLAVLHVSGETVVQTGGSWDDTDGLINTPLSARQVLAVVFLKEVEPGSFRVSLRSKGDVDVSAVAKAFGGGGHKNAAACSATGRADELRALFMSRVLDAIDRALPTGR
jgi:phosphoesterase RecJ-like protein